MERIALPEGKAGSPSLYAARDPVSSRQWGFFRRMKWWIMGVTLAIYYVTPLTPLGPRCAFA